MEINERVRLTISRQQVERSFVRLVAIVIDDDFAIRLPLAFLDDRGVTGFAFLDDGCSLTISIAVVRAYSDAGSNWANSDPNANLLRARRYCGA
jgi:hypothetical protein